MRTAVLAAPVLIAPLLVVADPGQTASAAAQMCQGRPATIIGTAGKDTLHGTDGRDVIVGLGRGDVIFGGGGKDVVCGGAGPDEIHGDAGDDRLYGGGDGLHFDRGGSYLFGDVIDGGAGDDVLDVGPWVYASYRFGEQIEFRDAPGAVTVDLTTGRAEGQGSDRIVRVRELSVRGSDEADVISGTPGSDRVESGGGDDQVHLGAGRDVWRERRAGDSGNDVVDGGGGHDTLTSTGGQDSLTGAGQGDVVFLYGSGARMVDTGPGPDEVYLEGTDLTGVSLAAGASDADYLYVDAPSQPTARTPGLFIDAVAGVVTLSVDGVATSGTLGGFEGFRPREGLGVEFHGSDESEVLDASLATGLNAWMGGGNDTVFGTQKDDSIDGGAGNDTAHGSGGTDMCAAVEEARSC